MHSSEGCRSEGPLEGYFWQRGSGWAFFSIYDQYTFIGNILRQSNPRIKKPDKQHFRILCFISPFDFLQVKSDAKNLLIFIILRFDNGEF